MTKKQILFWRILLILIFVIGGYFIIHSVILKGKQRENSVPKAKEIKFNIRKPDFYKGE